MKKFGANGMKALKVIHIAFACLWLGGAASTLLLRSAIVGDAPEVLHQLAISLAIVDDWAIIPGAMGCLFTGLVYGIWSNWGFFRHRWITVKWVLTIFMILFGTFYMGPRVSANVENFNDTVTYWQNLADNFVAGIIQLTMLLLVVIISVYKPWKKKVK